MKHFKRYSPLIIIIFVISAVLSCTKEAPTVNLEDYFEEPVIGVNPGYFYPFVSAVYPADGSTDVPVNTKFVIVFNMPVDADDFDDEITATGGGVPLYSFTPNSGQSTTATINFASQLPGGTVVTVTVGSGIHELVSGTDVGIILTAGAGFSWTFTTGTAPDVVNPTIVGGSNAPTGIDVSLTAPNIEIDFNEPVNPATINSSNFYLERIDPGPTYVLIPTVCGWSPTANPTTATLTRGEALEPSTQYRVTVTTGITDLSGNALSTGTAWTFTTADGDPDSGSPSVTSGPTVVYVTDDYADLTWTTDEATSYTQIHYGRGDDTSLIFLSSGSLSTTHSDQLTGLSGGRRYYTSLFTTDFSDFIGNPGAADSAVAEFNTETPETPLEIDINDNSQLSLKWITYHPATGTTGAFMFWSEYISGNYYLYGKLFNNTLGDVWSVGTRKALFTGSSTTYLSSVEDGLDGVVVITTRSGTDIYAKRIDDTGSFVNWGAGTTTDGGAGLTIGTGTYASAVPVYSGFLNELTSGATYTTNMSNLPNANVFYDFDANLSTATNGDLVINTGNGQISTVTVPFSNFNRNTLYQDSIVITAPASPDYRVIDAGVNQPGTSDFSLVNGTTVVYASTNTFTDPGWLSAAVGYTGDIMEVNGVYAYITALNTSFPDIVSLGTSENYLALNHLVDSGANWGSASEPVSIGDMVQNTTIPATALVTAVSATDLTLDADIFSTAGGQNYDITGTVDSGTSDAVAPPDFHLTDSSASWIGTVSVGDLVENLTTPGTALVTAIAATDLTLDTDIFSAGSENYYITRSLTGTSSIPAYSNILYDSTASWGDGSTGPIYVGNTVTNTVTGLTATVTVVTNNQITLSANRFRPSGNEGYQIRDTFYRFTLSTAVDILTDPNFIIYNNVALVAGTADIPPANPLYDNDPATIFTTLGVAAGDVVFNYTDSTVGQVDISAPFTVRARAFDIDGPVNMFSNLEEYRIFEFLNNNTYSDIVTTGQATGGSATTLVNTGTNFITDGVTAGDIAYNVNDTQYAMITGVAANTLTLSRDATFGNTDRYIIVHGTSVLNVWYNGINIRASIYSMADGTPLRTEYLLVAGTNPYTVSDGNGNAYLIYISGGQLMAGLYNAAGNAIWTSPAIGAVSAIHKVISDNNGGVIVLYQNGGTMYARRIRNNAGAYDSPWVGTIATAAPTSYDIVCNSTATDVIIAGTVGDNIYAWRRGGTTWSTTISDASGTQQNPKVFVNSWTVGTGYATIIWEDDRFASSAGYGIFGMQVDADDGSKFPGWRANTSGTDDYYGVSIVLNSENEVWSNIQIVSYDNGNEAVVIWEDKRYNIGASPTRGMDLLYREIDAFVPY